MSERPKKRRLWDIDPSIFELRRRASLFERRIVPPLRQLGKYGLYGLAITYPFYLVFVGLAFGGLVFWAFLVGSMAAFGIVIAKLGYGSNFRQHDVSLKRTVGLLLSFPLAAGFYAGLIYLKTWFVPVALVLLALGIFLVLRRDKS